MKRHCAVLALSILGGSCAASEDSQSKAATPVSPPIIAETPTRIDASPATVTPTGAVPSISSVQLNQDCPDPKSAASGARARRSQTSAGFAASCSQSFVQLAFSGQGEEGARVELLGLRLLSAEGKQIGTLNARLPSIWRGGVYESWDGMLPAEPDQKVSYKLSLPDWAALEKETGASSYGQIFLLEIDVDIAGTTTTLRSPQFEREMDQAVRT